MSVNKKDIHQILHDVEKDWEWQVKDMSDEELIEDPECIGDMRSYGKPTPDKRSLIYSYKFEDQDFKLRKSKKTIIANNQDIEQKDFAGTIIDIDYKKKEGG